MFGHFLFLSRVRFEVLTAMSIKIMDFWHVALNLLNTLYSITYQKHVVLISTTMETLTLTQLKEVCANI